jgi:predicted amidohydrolase
MRWLPARAHDNGMYLVFANGVGLDDDEVRTGSAMVLDCYGRIVNESTAIGDDLVVARLDASLRERSTGARWIKARRPELYGPLVERSGKEQDTRSVRFEYDNES